MARAAGRTRALVAALLLAALCAPRAVTAAADVDDIPFDQPAPGGDVVSVTWNVTVGRRAPDCFGAWRARFFAFCPPTNALQPIHPSIHPPKTRPHRQPHIHALTQQQKQKQHPHTTHTVRDVLLINGRFLGRENAITLRRGDVLDITLINSLPPDYPEPEGGLTLHFHGFAMAAGQSPW